MNLPIGFYLQPTVEAARNILGHRLLRKIDGQWVGGRIIEAEAYCHDDPACHAFKGKTKRNEAMFGPPGRAYVYFTYGMHHCFNAVTSPEGCGEAVLVRAILPEEGIDIMRHFRRGAEPLATGPGRLCQALNLHRDHTGLDLTSPESELVIVQDRLEDGWNIVATSRIGITNGKDKLWRFVAKPVRR